MTVREGAGNGLRIEISGIPAENGKCRVETQLKIGIHLRGPHGEAFADYKQLRLLRPLIAKEKHRMEKFNGRDKHLQDSEILILEARLVCDHDMTKVLECCDNCIGRERKRAHRRKEAPKSEGGEPERGALASTSVIPPVFGAIHPKKNSSGTAAAAALADEYNRNPPTPMNPVEYQAWERSRIMVFSSTEYVDLSDAGECVLPTRITCYCRHHNEKVGFRIQFTARDSTGAIVSTVLTNPVMMMDDHKSGKRAVPGETSSVTGVARGRPAVTPGVRYTEQQLQQHSSQDDQDDIELDDEPHQEDPEELDLETRHRLLHSVGLRGVKVEDENEDEEVDEYSKDVISPLEPTSNRMVGKRRVDDDDEQMMSDSFSGQQQSYRRKTSHDISLKAHFPLSATSAFSFTSTSRDATLSPFMPGSPFANEEERNVFAPTFGQAMAPNGTYHHQHQRDGDIFSSTRGNGPLHLSQHELKFHAESAASSMMENFTTLDESMSTPSNDLQPTAFFSSGRQDSPPTPSSAFPTRASFSIPTTIHSTSSNLYQPMSPFSPTFASPFDENISASNSSFLDSTQMQEFHNFHRQNQQQQQHQQQLLLQLQCGIQRQPQPQPQQRRESQPWIPTPSSEKKDPFQNMKAALAKQNAEASLSAFITIPTSLPDNIGAGYITSATNTDENSNDPSAQALPSKKRGRPRKGLIVIPNAAASARTPSATASGASSPMISPKAPSTNMPPSPSPPPFLSRPTSTATTPTFSAAGLTELHSSTSATAVAQFLLFQQQHQHHQQQLQLYQQRQHQHVQQQQQLLQQQQKQAILARQQHQTQLQLHQMHQQHQQRHQQQFQQRFPPRIQKLIPAKGTIEGGMEITLLGTDFFRGMVPTFDGVPALSVQYYGPETVICRLPSRAFPGVVVVKAQQRQRANSISTKSEEGASSPLTKCNSQELAIRTMSQFFGGSSAASLSMPSADVDVDQLEDGNGDALIDNEVGILFEYEEDKGDRDLIALALQVLGMKMNGRVEPPREVAMRIMATAAAQQQLAEQQDQPQQHQRQQQQLQIQQQHQHYQRQHQQQQGMAMTAPASPTPTSMALTKAANKSKVSTVMSRGPSPTTGAGAALMPIPLQSPQSLQPSSFLGFDSMQGFQAQYH